MGDFSKIDLLPPVALFQKMRVLHDLAKIAIPLPFGHFWSRDNAICARVLVGLFSEGIFLGDF